MVHGGSRSFRYEPEDDEMPLEWTTIGAWHYALGRFGTIKGFSGPAPWVVRIGRHIFGLYQSLDAARRDLERAAFIAGRHIAR